jgi:hypothetical protein
VTVWDDDMLMDWRRDVRRWLRYQISTYGRRAIWARWLHQAIHNPKTVKGRVRWFDEYDLWQFDTEEA